MSVETIIAQATPPGRGGVAITRISGPKVKEIAQQILKKIPQPRLATYHSFLDEKNEIIDSGIAIFFPEPHSFTGEDVLELHGHGGQAVIQRLINRIIQLGVRLANPGEFSERAFLNNKIDLIQAEAIADLIDASSEAAACAAIKSLQGEFSKAVNALVNKLIHLRMFVEASIDFADEEIDFLEEKKIHQQLEEIIQNVEHVEQTAYQGSLFREGIQAVIAGKPNVGKSSLLNRLSGKETAIVTEIPGTTRDILKEYILIDGMPMHIMDTAGLRESFDVVEQEGIRRAQAEIKNADIILLVIDATQYEVIPEEIFANKSIFIIRNKIDLLSESPSIEKNGEETIISISAKNNQGISLLKETIKSFVGMKPTLEIGFSARQRHLEALREAKSILLACYDQMKLKHGSELLAEDLRQAQKALDEITGQFTTDDLLGRIFSSFCVGK